jgi:thymidylate kinase
VLPRVRQGRYVVVDNWYGKFIAKVHVDGCWPLVDFQTVFESVPAPHLTVFLDIEPAIAERRKDAFTTSETGLRVREDLRPARPDTFVSYQARVAAAYHALAPWGGWQSLDVRQLDADDVAARVVELASAHAAATPRTTGAR